MMRLLRCDESELHRRSFAKKAAAGELLTLGGRQPSFTVRAIGTGTVDPRAQRGLREIEVARGTADALALVEH
jgi:hypothetical protein